MTDIEKLKKEIEILRDKYSTFKNYNEYMLLSVFRMRSVYSKILHIDEDTIFETEMNVRFLAKILNLKKEFDINGVKLDILNNMSTIDICAKWREPEPVINEIRENIDKEDFIISSRLYPGSDVAKLFGFKNPESAASNPVLAKINESKGKNLFNYWSGKKLIENYEKISRGLNSKKVIKLDNIEYVALAESCSLLGVTDSILRKRLIDKQKIFGVQIGFKRNYIGSGEKVLFLCKLKDVKKAKTNSKYYIGHADFRESNNIDYCKLRTIHKCYFKKYNEKLILIDSYIKKEKLARIVEIANELGYLIKEK